jgi:hypothetical protein
MSVSVSHYCVDRIADLDSKFVKITWYSEAVTHPINNQAKSSLTAVIERGPLFNVGVEYCPRFPVVTFAEWSSRS